MSSRPTSTPQNRIPSHVSILADIFGRGIGNATMAVVAANPPRNCLRVIFMFCLP